MVIQELHLLNLTMWSPPGHAHCTLTDCKYGNDKYKLECAKCKRLVHYGCTSLPHYQLQLFLTKGYQKFICCKCIEIHSYLYAISFSQNKAHLKKKKKKENSGSKKKDSLRPVLLRNWKENSGSKKKDSLRSVLLRNWKENSGSKKKDSLRLVLLRNWKENSRIKKKDSLRSETQITIHLLKLKDRWRNLWNILGKSLWKTCLLSYKIVREKCWRN